MENDKPSLHETVMIGAAAVMMAFFFLKIVFF
jgi:hypothetical protein